jgi:Tol biopolymer transport system component
MRLTPGTRLGPYEVLAPLGAGGMGEVYRARDSRLGRDVAIKVLPQHLSENPEVHARFEREARTISSLNHPHICTLHDVGREGDVEYLVMELVEGETLAKRLEGGAMPVTEVLRLGIQIADALDRAHRAGIVHRDFKPGNIMLTRSGAKLMDFGLARPTAAAGAPGGASGATIAHLTQSPTIASPLTAEGAIVGTFVYMAPEQLEGRETDVRSDLWAFGCVLYEMLTGRRAFEGKSQASLIGSIMHSEPPPLATTSPMAPPQLEALVRSLLAKDPEERVQTAHDVKLQLTWIAQAGSHPSIAAPALPVRRGPRREAVAWAVAAVALATAGFFAWRAATGGSRSGAGDEQVRFTIPVPPAVVALDMPRVSPDGRMVAFSAQDTLNRTMIWVRPLNSLAANPLPGTEGTRPPFWSPDSRYLGFIAGGKLKKIAVAGGPATVICDASSGSDGTWGEGDVILFDGGGNDPILRVSAAGGVATPAISSDSTFQVGWPAFLPDGRHFFYTKILADGAELMLGTLGDTVGRSLGISGSRVEYSPEGYLVFARDRTLMAQRFSTRNMKLEGEPFPVAEDLPVSGNANANFTVSRNGVLVYRSTGEMLNRLAWLDRTGRELAEVAPAADFRGPALSPDGRRIAIRRTDAQNLDVWVIDPARGTTTRFTFEPGADGNPVWSPDGTQIAWTGDTRDGPAILIKSASGLGEVKRVLLPGPASAMLDWSRDGGRLLYQALQTATGTDLLTAPPVADAKPEVLIQTPFNEMRARFSPDGRWVAYESNESGRAEIYVASLAGAAGKWQISVQGGSDPCWSRDGRELFYLSADQQLMTVPVSTDGGFHPGTPQPLFRVQVEAGLRRNVYDVAPDGQRFLFLLTAGQRNTPMTVVVNWLAGQKRR